MREFTSIEKLQYDGGSRASVLRYGEHVVYTERTWQGTYIAEVYEFVDNPSEDYDEIECRLNYINGNGNFTDGGHAVEWAFKYINAL